MSTTELNEQYPDVFKKLGGIIFNLNRIEISIIVTLTVFFTDESDAQSEKNFIFNDALFDENIFMTFESKRRMLLKVIDGIWRVAQENNLPFDRERWVSICKDISKVQEVRNKLAHHRLSFISSEKVGYYIRKGAKERLADIAAGKKGSNKLIEFDLDAELTRSQQVFTLTDGFLDEFLGQARTILASAKKARSLLC